MKNKYGLQEIRELLKIPRSQIEKDLFVRGQALFKWEKGLSNVPVEYAILLAKYFNMKVKDIDWNKKGDLNEQTNSKRITRRKRKNS